MRSEERGLGMVLFLVVGEGVLCGFGDEMMCEGLARTVFCGLYLVVEWSRLGR